MVNSMPVNSLFKFIGLMTITHTCQPIKTGTKSLKKWDFWPESGTSLRNLAKIAKITKFIRKKVHKKVAKNRDKTYFKQRKSRTVHQK